MKLRNFKSGLTSFTIAFSAIPEALPSAHAANATWSSSTTGNWSLGTNWVGSVSPGANGTLTSADIATFSDAAGGNITIDATAQNISGLLFSGTPGAYLIGSLGANAGNSLFLSSGGTINVTSSNAVNQTVNAPLVLAPASTTTAGTYTIQNNNSSTGALIIGGNITGGTTTQGITLTLAGTNTSASNLISGRIADGTAAGKVAVTKSGTGTWTLSGSNTYSGATTVSAGTLKAGSTSALSANSAFSVSAGATLNLGGFNNTIKSLDAGTATSTITDSSAAGSGGMLTITTALGAAPTQLFSGSLGLKFTGNNILSNASNTYSGGTIYGASAAGSRIITTGTIGTGTPGALTSGRLGTGNITLGLAATDKSQIYNNGTLVINNAIVVNTALGDGFATTAGAFRVEGGLLTLNGTVNANLADVLFLSANSAGQNATVTGAISGLKGVAVSSYVNGGLTLTLNSAANANTYAGNTTVTSGNAAGNSTQQAFLKLGASNQIADGAGKGNLIITRGFFNMAGFSETINGLSGNGTVDGGNSTATSTLTVGNADATGANNTFSGVLKNSTTGTLALTKIGTGTLTLSGTNTYTGVTTISAGTLSVNTLGNGGVAGALGNATSAAANLVFNGGTLQYTGGNTTSDRAFTLNAGTTGTIDTASNLSFAGATGTTTTGGLTKAGAGTLTLTGNSTYTGVTTLTGGTLSVSNIGNGGVAGGLGNATSAAANLVFNGGTLQYTGATATSDRAFTLNAGTTGTIDTANNISFAGATGTTTTGALTKTGAGTLSLTGVNTYTGATTLSAGTLDITGSASLNSGNYSGAITNNGNLSYSSSASQTLGGIISGNGTITKSGSSTLTLSGSNTYTGTTVVSGGTLLLGNSLAIQNSALDTTNSIVGNSTAGLKTNQTTLTLGGLTGNKDLQAVFTTAAGGANGTVGNGGYAAITGLTLTPGAGVTNTYSGNIVNGAAGMTLTKSGAGTQILSGTNTYSGNSTVSAGTLKAGSITALSTNSAFSVSAGATLDLGGFNNTIKSLDVGTATSTITDSSAAGSGGMLTVSTALGSATLNQLFTGSLGLNIFGGSSVNAILSNTNNTYSGGTIFGANGASFTRFLGSGTFGTGSPGSLTSGRFGTGTITIGLATTDKAQIYVAGGLVINNAIVVNTALGDGSQLGALRVESGLLTVAGTVNANLADVMFSANNAGGQIATVTGAISGLKGVQVLSQNAGGITLTLNSAANANTYEGNTTITSGNAAGDSTQQAFLKLGASDQIADGAGKGNLIITGGFFNMAGFSETINGLSGNGTVDGGNSTATSTLTVGNADATGANNTFSGVLKNTTGNLALTKIGTGTLTLSGTNTYTGVTTISAGTLSVNTLGNGGVAGALGNATSAAANLVFNGGTLQYTGGNTTSDRAFTLNAGTTGTIDTTSNFSLAGATGTATTGGLTKTGAGTLTLTGNSTYTGVTTLTGGTLSVSNIGNGGVAGGLGNATSEAANLVFNGGTLQYTGTTATSDRAFTLNDGTTGTIDTANDLSFAGATGTTTTGALTKTGAGTLSLTGVNTYTGATTLSAGTLDITGSASLNSGDYSGAITNNGNLSYSSSASQILGGIISGNGTITKSGSSTLTLSGSNTYSGTTLVSGGTLLLGNSLALQNSALDTTNSIAGNSTAGLKANQTTLTLGGLTGNKDLQAVFTTAAGGANGTVGNGGYAALTGLTLNPGAGVTNTYSGNIVNGAAAMTLTKSGNGTQVLSGTNTYSGATTVNAGTLKLGSATGISSTSALTVSGGTFDLNGFDATVASIGAGNALGTISNSAAGTGTNTLTYSGSSANVATLITDGATAKTALLMQGSQSVPWLGNANNTFSGGLTLLGGSSTRLYQLASATTTVDANGTILKSNFGTGAINIGATGNSTGSAQLAITTPNQQIYNAIVFNGGNTYVDGGGGAFRTDTTGILLSGTLTAGASNMSFSSGGTGTVTATGKLTGTNGLMLNTSNITLTLANAAASNDYAGDTTLTNLTTLRLGASNQIADGAGKGNLIVTSGTFNMAGFSDTINGLSGNGTVDGGNSTTTSTLTVGNNDATGANNTFSGVLKNTTGNLALTKTGAGTLTLSGINTYTGATTISSGILAINGIQSAATGDVTVASGATLKGTGTVGGSTTVQSGGIHNAGAHSATSSSAVGTETFSTNLTYASSSIFAWDLNANLDGDTSDAGDTGTAGTNYDRVVVGGNLNIASDAVFRVIMGSSVDFATTFWDSNQVWNNIFSVTGTTTGGWAVNTFVNVYNYDFANNTYSVSNPTAKGFFTVSGSSLAWNVIPEPTSALAGLLIGAGLLRRRRCA